MGMSISRQSGISAVLRRRCSGCGARRATRSITRRVTGFPGTRRGPSWRGWTWSAESDTTGRPTRGCELFGVRYPIVQTGMGFVSGPRLAAATANAGGLGILASATMSYAELAAAVEETRSLTAAPFGVNLRADAPDAIQRVELLISRHVKVASFALAPRQELIARLKDAGVVVVPSVGARRHAEKVAAWGADAVVVQGSEGGGHTGQVATPLLLPQAG